MAGARRPPARRGPQVSLTSLRHFQPLGWAGSARPGHRVRDTQPGRIRAEGTARMLCPCFLGSWRADLGVSLTLRGPWGPGCS